MNATLQRALDAARAGLPWRMYRVSFAWRRGTQLFRATTLWGASSPSDALSSLGRCKPEVISAQVVEEVTP